MQKKKKCTAIKTKKYTGIKKYSTTHTQKKKKKVEQRKQYKGTKIYITTRNGAISRHTHKTAKHTENRAQGTEDPESSVPSCAYIKPHVTPRRLFSQNFAAQFVGA